jgi:hypothetical protein
MLELEHEVAATYVTFFVVDIIFMFLNIYED